ncbi:MAG TPA: LLM class flavin-dependent oxidoreductase [Acidimicrobiia bacterium]|jgi:alkanesulfonate monooxygenase SsuD/methylene tetrahydromethanopterin reductase-like flavin-dependent oxidoreductase (luciferase family)
MRIGVVILPDRPWREAEPLWRRAEELGFAHAWTYDHLAWRELRDAPWFGAMPTLTAAATATERIRLGPLVTSPNFRHPVSLARELIALDDISAGRLELGIGAGGEGWDAVMLGGPPWSRRERADRFDEFVVLLDELLRNPETTRSGAHYSAYEARTYPGCVQEPRVPFAVAASGPRGLRLAARLGQTWVTVGDPSAPGPTSTGKGLGVVHDQVRRLEDACADAGRDPASIRRLVLAGPLLDEGLGSAAEFHDTVARYAEIGITDFVVHWPRETEPYRGDVDTFEQAIAGAVDRA